MRFIAEVISVSEIAVWVVEDGYIGDLHDGMYTLVGIVQSPLFPNYKTIAFESKNQDKHFVFQDYDKLITDWNNGLVNGQPPPQPPASWVLRPHLISLSTFSSPPSKLPCFAALAIHKYLLPVEEVTFTKELQDSIKKQFSENKYTFSGNHGDTKAILIGTIQT
jgi:hypothetical protein